MNYQLILIFTLFIQKHLQLWRIWYEEFKYQFICHEIPVSWHIYYLLEFVSFHPRHPIIRQQIWMNLPKNEGFEDNNHKWWLKHTIHMLRKTPGCGGLVIYELPHIVFINPPHPNNNTKIRLIKNSIHDLRAELINEDFK